MTKFILCLLESTSLFKSGSLLENLSPTQEIFIQATVIKQAANGSFYASNGWTFNNLTYQPSARAIWKGNPLATPGTHVVNGRKWFTECDNAKTGRNGCRTYAEADVIAAVTVNGVRGYRWETRMVLNNIVRFR